MVIRVLIVLILLLTSVCRAAPAPQAFKAGWNKPLDPDNDCKFIRDQDSLTIELPGTCHDFNYQRDYVNAPRLLREVKGDFRMQVRVRLDGRPSAKATAEGQLSSIAGGFFLLIPHYKDYFRLEYGINRQGRDIEDYAAHRCRSSNALWSGSWKNWPLPEKGEHAYLRLERRGTILYPSLSPDGEKWTPLSGLGIEGLPAELQIGLAAYSTSSEPSKVRFDQFKFTQSQKEKH